MLQSHLQARFKLFCLTILCFYARALCSVPTSVKWIRGYICLLYAVLFSVWTEPKSWRCHPRSGHILCTFCRQERVNGTGCLKHAVWEDIWQSELCWLGGAACARCAQCSASLILPQRMGSERSNASCLYKSHHFISVCVVWQKS